jgi:hypothetical protein
MLTPTELQKAVTEMENILVEARDMWREKRGDYGDAFMELGDKGQFSEIWRKVYKLKRSVWEGYELHGETPEQIAMELIPHCLMLVYLIRQERNGGSMQ